MPTKGDCLILPVARWTQGLLSTCLVLAAVASVSGFVEVSRLQFWQ
jgi:hypothetical protein